MDIRKVCGTNSYSSLHVEELKRRDVMVSDTLTINADIDILEVSCQNYRVKFDEVNLNPTKVEALVANMRRPDIAAAMNPVSTRCPLAVWLARKCALTINRSHRVAATISPIEWESFLRPGTVHISPDSRSCFMISLINFISDQ